MGYFLKQELGTDYEAVALIASESKIDWPGVGCGSTGVAAFPSVEAELFQLAEPFLFVDLDFPGAEEPLLVPDRRYELNDSFMTPRREFRALFYMETAEKMVPLAWPACSG